METIIDNRLECKREKKRIRGTDRETEGGLIRMDGDSKMICQYDT